ncbi:hypothetical protein RGQ30_16930 [Limnobacter thiooxidans]|jgi:hypothetical protein|uniref:Uncharacterized protein n=1 Tax=Limnobacter thiooxidans TaxID=131080 RepID=A0AA86IZ01_9BURK|nr:hypothetical protein RGQ30_16930 [Limnobacter thiooxidans]
MNKGKIQNAVPEVIIKIFDLIYGPVRDMIDRYTGKGDNTD